MIRLLAPLLALLVPAAAFAAPLPRVAIETSLGPIVVELEAKRAPITVANFFRYVDAKKFDGKSFYRAARNRRAPGSGLVQGGMNRDVAHSFAPIAHEPTSRTGLAHVDGTISMARNAPGTAMGDFFFTLGPSAYLDARPGSAGYAAFGRVVSGLPILKTILAGKTWPGGWTENTVGQSLVKPVKIVRVRRLR